MFEILYKPSVEKDFRKLAKDQVGRILERIEGLKQNPKPTGSLKLTGADRLHRLRVGDYRVVYEVDEKKAQVTVHYVRHRRDVYRDL